MARTLKPASLSFTSYQISSPIGGKYFLKWADDGIYLFLIMTAEMVSN